MSRLPLFADIDLLLLFYSMPQISGRVVSLSVPGNQAEQYRVEDIPLLMFKEVEIDDGVLTQVPLPLFNL
jgi:hypothetical protein